MTLDSTAPHAPPPFGAADAWRPGAQVGEHVVERVLGRGGMGVVYLARHVPTGEPRALKTLRHDADPKALARFRREGEAQARVDRHPNVVRVHSAGDHGGRAYLVLELAAGGDLAARLREGPLPSREAARVVALVARGLAHAHRHGVLHRDVKPANVLFDEAGTPKLVDFGVARLASQGTVLTRTGEALGTPAYMAPEQVDGARDADVRSDVYGLGGLLYAALTGDAPFSAGSSPELFRKVFFEAPAPPSAVRADVPGALDAICLRALAKEPADRFQTVQQMVEALDAFLAGRAQGARRQLVPVVAAVGALALLVGGAGWHMTRAPAIADPPAPTAPPPSAASESAARPANETPWVLERGDELRLELTWDERNDKGVRLRARGSMELRVERRDGARAWLSSTLWLSELGGRASDTDMAGIPVEAELLARAQGRRELTCELDLATGRVTNSVGLDALREELWSRVKRTAFDVDGQEYQGQRMLRLMYDAGNVGRVLDLAFGLFDPAAGWRRRGAEHHLLLKDEADPPLPLLIADPEPGRRFRVTGTAKHVAGRLAGADLEQTGEKGGEVRWESRLVLVASPP